VLSGAVTHAQLGSNLAALEVELHAGELAELAALEEPADAYWATRSARAWE
jgi:aryl-alcohol dehydrogenase-like predicted oxidoreductase